MQSVAQSFSPEQIKMFQQLLAMGHPIVETPLVEIDYTTDESDSGCDESHVKLSPGRPKKVRSPEWIAAREASKAKGRGRPLKLRTSEELVEIADAVEAKEERRRVREANKIDREVADAIRQQVREERQVKADQKALEKAEREATTKAKRTEIYEKMMGDAESYKAKWGLQIA